VAAGVLGVLVAGGCAHYAVSDRATGATYYTKHVDRNADGTVAVTDKKTGHAVTVHNPDVRKISKKEYKQGIGKK
jgi:predicted secreted hydrolase